MNEDGNDSGLSKSAQGVSVSSSSPVAGLTANTDQGLIRSSSATLEDPPLTWYKLLNIMTALLWAVPKAIFSYKNAVVVPSTLDLLGVLCGIPLYWVGQYEGPGKHRKKWDWFFEHDLAPAFRKYLFGGGAVVWALSALCNVLVLHPFISLLFLCACFVLARYLPDWGAAIVSIALALPVVIICMGLVVRATLGRTPLHIP
ncbi:hypothetical protein V8E53_009117 [Lactarius tabidus]